MFKIFKSTCALIGGIIIVAIAVLFAIYTFTGEVSVGKFMLQKTAPLTLDQTYVISLDRTPERYELINKDLTHHKVSHVRFSAVDGLTLPIKSSNGISFTGLDVKEKKIKLHPNEQYGVSCPSLDINYTYDKNILHRPLIVGELGLYCSHLEIWQDILNKKYTSALILEDDAILSPYFEWQLNSLLRKIPQNNWDIIYIYIGQDPDKSKYTILNNQALYKYDAKPGALWGTVAYFVSERGARKLLASTQDFKLPIDNVIGNLITQGIIDAYVLTTLQYIDHDHKAGSTIGTTASSNRE